jgi:lipopolysaccharide cholinephosphotransferase
MAVELREFQLFQMNILNEIDRVCKKNGLTWYAGWGTLLGAARHQGFIPWDDDIDIIMPHKDYLAFRDACARDLDERFYLQVHSVNPANDIVWQRVGVKNSTSLPVDSRDIPAEWGVCVDIFTLFPCPDPESSKYDDFLKECDRFYRTSSLYRYRKMARGQRPQAPVLPPAGVSVGCGQRSPMARSGARPDEGRALGEDAVAP